MVWTSFTTCVQVKEKIVKETECIYVYAADPAYVTV